VWFALEDDGRTRTITTGGVTWRRRAYIAPWMVGRTGTKVRTRHLPHHDAQIEVFGARPCEPPARSAPRPLLLAAVYLQRFTRPDLPLLAADPLSDSDLPGLTRFAETCKLRPLRPKRARARVGKNRKRRPSPSEPATNWPLCSVYYHFRCVMTEQMDGCPQPPDHTCPKRTRPVS
jgi:hypothetical protein